MKRESRDLPGKALATRNAGRTTRAVPAAVRMSLLSTGKARRTTPTLTTERLFRELQGARGVDIAAAYYDLEFCRTLLRAARANTLQSIRLLFNRLGGSRLMEQKRQLQGLMRSRAGSPSVDIRLAQAPGIFHSKLIFIHKRRSHVGWVGSANATRAAFERNEEIMLRLDGELGTLEDYFDTTWENAVPLQSVNAERARTLIDFFRSGSLFFKASRQVIFTFNPFTEMVAAMSDSDRRKLEQIVPEYADSAGVIGPFNVIRALSLRPQNEGHDDPVQRVGIAARSVETCYGYWVPHDERSELLKRIAGAGASREKGLGRIRSKMQQVGPDAILNRFRDYLRSVRLGLLKQGFDEASLARLGGDRVFSDSARFERFYAKLEENLSNDAWVKRYAAPLLEGSVPEIWDDPVASDEFETSFFESLAFAATRPRLTRTARQILTFAEAPDATAPETLAKFFARALRQKGWPTAGYP